MYYIQAPAHSCQEITKNCLFVLYELGCFILATNCITNIENESFGSLFWLFQGFIFKFIFISELNTERAELSPIRASQGKTFENNEDCCTAAHAIDKDLSSVAATQTDDGAGWLKLELGRSYFIQKVVIYYWFYTNWFHPNDYCAESEANHKKCVDSDNNVDVSVYQGEVKQKSCGTLQLTYGLKQSDQIYTLTCNTDGNTVKLRKNYYEGGMAVCEVIVLGSKHTGKVSRGYYKGPSRISWNKYGSPTIWMAAIVRRNFTNWTFWHIWDNVS